MIRSFPTLACILAFTAAVSSGFADQASSRRAARPATAAPAAPAVPSPTPPPPTGPAMNIDFTPRYADVLFDGLPSHTLYLQNGPLKIFLQAPSGWQPAGGSAGLTLTSLNVPQAQIEFRPSKGTLPNPLDSKWIDNNKAQLLKAVSRDALNVQSVGDKPQPLNINSWRTYETTLSYELYGTKYTQSVCYIQLNSAKCVELTCLCRSDDFSRVHGAAFSMICSWLMPPEPVLKRMLR